MSLIISNLEDYLITNNIDFIRNFELSKKSWIKSGGLIDIFIKPKDINEIKNILKFFRKNNIDYYVIGNFSNTIIRDGLIITPFPFTKPCINRLIGSLILFSDFAL